MVQQEVEACTSAISRHQQETRLVVMGVESAAVARPSTVSGKGSAPSPGVRDRPIKAHCGACRGLDHRNRNRLLVPVQANEKRKIRLGPPLSVPGIGSFTGATP
jgi:hypothetical protein